MNITGKYMKVWEVKNDNGWKKVNLGDSRKLQDGSYQNFTWFDCSLVGKSKNVDISKGDTVEIKSGIIYMEKYKDKWYNRITIFDIGVDSSNDHKNNNSYSSSGSFEDDIPY